MKDVLDILGQTILIATLQPRHGRNTAPGSDDWLMEAPTRYRPERKADRKRIW
jgi:hypothetical protein